MKFQLFYDLRGNSTSTVIMFYLKIPKGSAEGAQCIRANMHTYQFCITPPDRTVVTNNSLHAIYQGRRGFLRCGITFPHTS